MTFAPRTWVVGEVVTAALLNQELRDQFNSMFGAWTSYTPTWTGSVSNPVIGNGTLTGRYMKWGRTVLAELYLVPGGTTTFGSGTYTFGAPVAKAASGTESGGYARLSAGSTYIGQCVLSPSSSSMNVTFPSTATPATAVNMSNTTPATLAAAHVLRMGISYEAAT